jgi:hypothetical protein
MHSAGTEKKRWAATRRRRAVLETEAPGSHFILGGGRPWRARDPSGEWNPSCSALGVGPWAWAERKLVDLVFGKLGLEFAPALFPLLRPKCQRAPLSSARTRTPPHGTRWCGGSDASLIWKLLLVVKKTETIHLSCKKTALWLFQQRPHVRVVMDCDHMVLHKMSRP